MNIQSLKRFSQWVVFSVFVLIFVGGLVTSWQAGMAVPDWPLSFGSLNPEGWWSRFPVRLEHGHRVLAALVGVLVGVLCARVWLNVRALWVAAIVAILAPLAARMLGAESWLIAHFGVWPAACAFAISLIRTPPEPHNMLGTPERRLAMGAFVLICIQATLGGLRVTRETAGAVDLAVFLRILHACVAQAFLVVLVSLSTRLVMLSKGQGAKRIEGGTTVRLGTLFAVIAVYLQLIIGATMRHLGAGLAIPTFPWANPEGGFLPAVRGVYTDLNFAHTRIGAVLVSILVLVSVFKILKSGSSDPALRWMGVSSLLLLVVQVTLGVLAVWHMRPPSIASLHVLVGAALLANLVACLVRLHPFTYGQPRGVRL